jgi:hypothetical protein
MLNYDSFIKYTNKSLFNKSIKCCLYYSVEISACSDRANKANFFISTFFLQAAK